MVCATEVRTVGNSRKSVTQITTATIPSIYCSTPSPSGALVADNSVVMLPIHCIQWCTRSGILVSMLSTSSSSSSRSTLDSYRCGTTSRHCRTFWLMMDNESAMVSAVISSPDLVPVVVVVAVNCPRPE